MSADVLVGDRRDRLRRLAHGGLQAGEGEVEPCLADQRPRKGKAVRIAASCRALDGRTAGIGKAEQLCRLVEGFPSASSIVVPQRS